MIIKRVRTFFFRLVCKHRTKCHITDTLDTLYGGVELIVNDNTTFGVNLNSDLVEVQTIDVRSATNGDQYYICFKLY